MFFATIPFPFIHYGVPVFKYFRILVYCRHSLILLGILSHAILLDLSLKKRLYYLLRRHDDTSPYFAVPAFPVAAYLRLTTFTPVQT